MTILKKQTVLIREPTDEDENNFLTAMQRSQILHHPWVKSPQTSQEFKNYMQRCQQDNQKSFLVCDQLGHITGVFNVNEIVRGLFQSAYLGFYAVADYAGKGYMNAGLVLMLQKVFVEMNLHRLEANIQPENIRSINLVKNNGFRKEGYSTHYLNINGLWRDHERWAITYEDFNQGSKANIIDRLDITVLHESDIDEMVLAFKNITWNKPKSLYAAYLKQQGENLRTILVAKSDEKFCGYVTLKWQSEYEPFSVNNIPEISDLNVLPDFRQNGIGTALIQYCEKLAKEHSYTQIGLGVGMTADYGNAQRLYIKLGYVPDGNGLHYHYRAASYSEAVIVDDDLVLYLIKKVI